MPVIAVPIEFKLMFEKYPLRFIVDLGAYPLESEYQEIQRLREKIEQKRQDRRKRDALEIKRLRKQIAQKKQCL